MNHHKFLLSAPYDDVDVETEGPTFAIAIGQALPNLSRRLGNSRTILGARPFQDGRKDFYGFELDVDPDEVTSDLLINRYGARQPVPAPSEPDHLEIEAYDVYETMGSIEGLLRYAAQDLIDDERWHGLIRERALEYRQAVSDVLVYDPKAKIDMLGNLDELFAGRDWSPFFSPALLVHPVVQIGQVDIVEKTDDEILLRFEYWNGDDHGRELEFADTKNGRHHVRRSRYSALRAFDPAFSGWQLPAVHDASQEALDTGRHTDLSDANWAVGLSASEADLEPA
jgi:hypothetical protein